MTFRYARHTSDLKRIENFYTKIIGLKVLGGFENHSDYNGLFLGFPNENWHLEFTTSKELPNHRFDEDDALVFYFDSQDKIEAIEKWASMHGTKKVSAKNPYWDAHGITLIDPDGCFVILAVR